MTRLCIDTSAFSHFQRGDTNATDAIDGASFVLMPSIVLGELRAGFRRGSRTRENESILRAFLDEPVVAQVGVDDATASHYADLWAELRRRGTPVPTNDLWIAAVALREGATVLTFDAHFESIPRVSVHLLVNTG